LVIKAYHNKEVLTIHIDKYGKYLFVIIILILYMIVGTIEYKNELQKDIGKYLNTKIFIKFKEEN